MSDPAIKLEWDEADIKKVRKILSKKESALKKIPQAVRLATNEARRVAQSNTPKRSGRLKNSYKVAYSDGGKKSTITNEAKNTRGQPYAVYPEFGKGRGWAGKEKAFFRSGQSAGSERLLKECKKLLEEE